MMVRNNYSQLCFISDVIASWVNGMRVFMVWMTPLYLRWFIIMRKRLNMTRRGTRHGIRSPISTTKQFCFSSNRSLLQPKHKQQQRQRLTPVPSRTKQEKMLVLILYSHGFSFWNYLMIWSLSHYCHIYYLIQWKPVFSNIGGWDWTLFFKLYTFKIFF